MTKTFSMVHSYTTPSDFTHTKMHISSYFSSNPFILHESLVRKSMTIASLYNISAKTHHNKSIAHIQSHLVTSKHC